MTDALSAERSERAGERRGYRSGSYSRSLITRVGTIELRVPRDRSGLFSTELFERYQRSEKALVSALAEMYVQGVSTRKVKAVSETLCGHSFSAAAISGMNQTLDAALTAFSTRRLAEPYPYLILDARYERVREGGVIASQAVLVAVAVDGQGRRQILGVELANRESTSSWRDFLLGLKQRGLHGVEFVVSDNHSGLKQAIREVLSEAAWQRCIVHTIRTQLRVGDMRAVAARLVSRQRNDMADLQAVFADDDALDDQLQDRLLFEECRFIEAGRYARAERRQVGPHDFSLYALLA